MGMVPNSTNGNCLDLKWTARNRSLMTDSLKPTRDIHGVKTYDRKRCPAELRFAPFLTFNFDGQLRRKVSGSPEFDSYARNYIDFIEFWFETCPYKRLICCV